MAAAIVQPMYDYAKKLNSVLELFSHLWQSSFSPVVSGSLDTALPLVAVYLYFWVLQSAKSNLK